MPSGYLRSDDSGNPFGNAYAEFPRRTERRGFCINRQVSADMQWKGLPMVVLASLALFFCGEDKLFDGAASDVIDRTDGLMFLLFFVIFMVYPFGMSRQSSVPAVDQPDKLDKSDWSGKSDNTSVS